MRQAITSFRGAALAPHPKLLAEDVGVDARNMDPSRGDLRPWSVPQAVATVPGGRQTIYRMGRDVPSDTQYWLSFTGVVHAVRAQIGSDTTERTYYTGDGVPKFTDNTIGLAGGGPYPSAFRTLGVPVPIGQPQISAAPLSAGEEEADADAEKETLYYVYTFVTSLGEESAPSPVSAALRVSVSRRVNISNIDPAPSGAFVVNRVRIYRTATSDANVAAFQFLREIPAGTSSTVDDRRGLGEVLPTVGWLPPPADLRNLTGLWNGMFAGISGKAVRVCVAYVPYAWPIDYEVTTPDAAPVALGVFGQSLLILTTAKPVLVAGSSPDALDAAPVEFAEACVSGRSVVSMGVGVVWACPDGLAWYGQGGAKIITDGIFTRRQWQAMNPAGIVAARYEGMAFVNYTDADGIRRAFLIDPLNPKGVLFLEKGYDAVYFDELTDSLYVLEAGQVSKWNAGATMMTARFVSKVFLSPPLCYGSARVLADTYPVTLKVDAGPLPAAALASLVARNPARLSAVGSMLRYTVAVQNHVAFRLPAGFQATEWQVTVEATGGVQSVVLGESPKETL